MHLGGASKSSSTRRQVTVANDDGHVRWGDLTAGEKVARSTQQSFNFLVVIVGILATQGAVGYVIYTEVLSPEGTTNQYHRALKKIKEDSKCVELLGDPRKIVARGEQFRSRHKRIVLEDADAWAPLKKKSKFFGVRWW
ncbi:mitochondrial import inner membrane translocase subunit tim21 [Botryosphaeria dothidea]